MSLIKQMGKCFAIAALLATPLLAQFDAAAVVGTVRDRSDAAIVNASIVLTNQNTGLESKTNTDENGNYTFFNVKIGTYTVTAEANGFSKALAKDVVLNVNARQRVDMTLQVGTVAESIEVTDAVTALQTDSSERGQVIQGRQIVELPLNGRQYSDLALLTTGVVRTPGSLTGGREGAFSINGLRSTYNNFILDGVDNNAYGTSNQGFANQVAQPSPDSIAEFKVITNNYSAEFGRSGGGTINVATKGGTNAFHGTAYDFLRNTELNAIGYIFGARPATFKKPTLQQNQFGLTLGGRIIKDRLFYFGDYEGFRSLARRVTIASIPTMDDRAGILSVNVTNPLTGQTFAAGTPVQMTSFARKVLNDLPVPTNSARSNNYQQLTLDRNYNDKYDGKLDGQINDKMLAFGRWSQRKVNIFNEPSIPGLSGGNSNGFTRILNQQLALGYTWTITPRSMFETRYGWSKTRAGKFPPLIGGSSMLALYGITGLPTTPELTGGLTATTLTGFDQLGRQSTNPQFQNPTGNDLKFNFSQVLGRQAIKVGFEFVTIHTEVNDINPLYGRDAYQGNYTGLGGTNGSLADFYFGLRSQYALANYVVGNYRQREYFWYVQDDIRVNSKLTLNLGLRYEYATPRWEANNVLSNFDPATKTMLTAKDGDIYSRSLVNPDKNNFAPRFGFAYSVNPKTVVRGGYGWSYIHQNRVGSADLLGINYPQVVIATINNPSDPKNASFVTTQQGYPSGLTNAATFPILNANIAYIPSNYKSPYVQSFFFGIQRELVKDLVLDLSYVGNRGVGIPVIGDYNQANPNTTSATCNSTTTTGCVALNSRRPIQGIGAVTWFYPGAFSRYDGLQFKVEKRLSGGVQFLNSLVWSKAIDTAAQSLDTNGGNDASPQDVRNMANEKGVSNYDQTLTDVLSVFYQVPFGKGRKFGSNSKWAVDSILGGWEMSVVNTSLSATPLNLRYTPSAAFQTVGNLAGFRGGETFRPNVIGPVKADNPADITNTFFNTANVLVPTDPSQPFGNAGRNSVRGFGTQQLDLAIHKNFNMPFREGMYMQFRAEMFNIFNHTNFLPPTTDRTSGAFGTVRSTLAPRQIQMALKLVW
jgi:outer membrane receptor protein involved in Fe transport